MSTLFSTLGTLKSQIGQKIVQLRNSFSSAIFVVEHREGNDQWAECEDSKEDAAEKKNEELTKNKCPNFSDAHPENELDAPPEHPSSPIKEISKEKHQCIQPIAAGATKQIIRTSKRKRTPSTKYQGEYLVEYRQVTPQTPPAVIVTAADFLPRRSDRKKTPFTSFQTSSPNYVGGKLYTCGNTCQGGDASLESSKKKKISFDERFDELSSYKTKFGHCRVPSTHGSEYCSLGRWVYGVRKSYWTVERGEGGRLQIRLSDSQIQRLEDLRFDWNIAPLTLQERGTSPEPSKKKRIGHRKTFDERFDELSSYKSKFGHCWVPSTRGSEYCSLGRWVYGVRKSYRTIRRGEGGRLRVSLSDSQIQRLEDLGFDWNIAT